MNYISIYDKELHFDQILENAVLSEENVPVALEYDDTEKRKVFYSYPIERGQINDLDALEVVIDQVLYHQSGWIQGQEESIVLVEPILNSRLMRERLTQLMFETFNVSSYFVTDSATASLYAIGKTSGIVVDMGHEKIDVAPVLDGVLQTSAASRINVGGKNQTESLRKLLQETYNVDVTFDEAEKMKTELCSKEAAEGQDEHERYGYVLPDGQKINTVNELKKLREWMLDPSIYGLDTPTLSQSCIHAGMVSAVQSERESRKLLMDNIFVCGGSSLLPDFSTELLKQVAGSSPVSAPPGLCSIPDYMPPQTKSTASWFGGAVIGSSISAQANPQMAQQLMTKAEYHEYGPAAIHRHCC